MPNKKNRNRRPSAASILSESEVNNNLTQGIPMENQTQQLPVVSDEKYMDMLKLERYMDMLTMVNETSQSTAKKVENFNQMIDKVNSTIDKFSSKLQIVHDVNRALIEQNRAIREENDALKKEMKSTKDELRALKDEFLMNLDRQNENTLVIHGLQEAEGESEIDLQTKVNNIVATNCGLSAPCAEAHRVGKKGPNPRVIKVRWENQKHCRNILEKHKSFPKGIYFNKDRPFMLREIKRKIRNKAKELWESNTNFEYKDLGLFYNGTFHHYTEFATPDA
jgi:hypothetical protein